MEQLAINGGTPVRDKKLYYGHQCIDDDDIKGSIIAYWSDIFPRLMIWSECYEKIGEGTEDEMLYFDYIVRPIFCKYLGYNYNRLKGTIEPIKKD